MAVFNHIFQQLCQIDRFEFQLELSGIGEREQQEFLDDSLEAADFIEQTAVNFQLWRTGGRVFQRLLQFDLEPGQMASSIRARRRR